MSHILFPSYEVLMKKLFSNRLTGLVGYLPAFVLTLFVLPCEAQVTEAGAPGNAAPLRGFAQRIRSKIADYRTSGSIVIVGFGDSLTMGATANGVYEPEIVYHAQLKKLLEQRYPRAIFSVINSGIGGDNATKALTRIDRDVVRYQPDLVIVGFGANDLSDDEAVAKQYGNSLRQIVRTLREKTHADIILVPPTYMASHDNGKIPLDQREMLQRLIHYQNDGIVKKYAGIVKDVGASENVPVADVYSRWEALAASGKDTTAMLVNGLNHPNADGHAIEAQLLMEMIDNAVKTAPK